MQLWAWTHTHARTCARQHTHTHTWCCASSRFPPAHRDRPRRWRILASSSFRPNCSARRRPEEKKDSQKWRSDKSAPRGWSENQYFYSHDNCCCIEGNLNWAHSTHICHSFSMCLCLSVVLSFLQSFRTVAALQFVSDMFHLSCCAAVDSRSML